MTAGIKWVVDHGARVVNLSLGDPAMAVTSLITPNDLLEGINYAWAHGAVPVVAGGNSNTLGLGLEGRSYGDMNAIIVGATGPDDRTAKYSTSTGGAKWAVVAPGGAADEKKADDILSTFWMKGQTNAYGTLAGTSMAAPQVTGAVALLLGEGYSPSGAVERLLAPTPSAAAAPARPATVASTWTGPPPGSQRTQQGPDEPRATWSPGARPVTHQTRGGARPGRPPRPAS